MAHMHCENGICRMVEDEDDKPTFTELTEFLETLRAENTPLRRRALLLRALTFAQKQYAWIGLDIQRQIAGFLQIPQTEIAGVIRFFKARFHGTEFVLQLCCGDRCFVKNAGVLSARLQKILGAFQPGQEEKRPNGSGFLVEISDCLGACAQAPVVRINGQIYSNPSEEELRVILSEVIQN